MPNWAISYVRGIEAVNYRIGRLAMYLLFVIMSNWAPGFMTTRLFGHINVALVFGLLQFVTTFGLAWVYSRYSTKKLDPLAEKLRAEYEAGKRGQS